YLGFMGAGGSVDLTEDMWGLQGGWRMPVPAADLLDENEELYLGFTVINARNFPDDSWREYLLKATAIGSTIALGHAIDIPGELVAAAKELGISENVLEIAKQLGFSGVLNAAEEWVSGLFASPPQCAGLVFYAQYPINPDRLDKLSFTDGGHISGALETVLKRQKIHAQSTPSVQEGCNHPNATAEFDIERETTLYFPQTQLHDHARIAGFMGLASAVPTGLLVDEETVYGTPQHRVKIHIKRREQDHADLFDVTVQEYDDHFQQFFTATFSGIWFEIRVDDMPSAKNIYGHHRAGFPVPEPLPIPNQQFPRERTLTTRMTAPDGTTCELSLWRSSTRDDQGAIILTTDQLRFSRSGTSSYSNTAAWLAPPGNLG
ncbi:MAG: hypothetical protein JWR80_9646, partial [Bradyrhizobium sp.]|nr:hypothetical protein [Bradyrhizobium sp.]